MINHAVMMTDEAIERVLDTLRKRMKDALANHQTINMHAKAGMKAGSVLEEDGSFAFTLLIGERDDARPAASARRCVYDGCRKDWEHERKSNGNAYRLCGEHNRLLFPILNLGPNRWICKKCGEGRRRGECLHCGNVEPITDEPMTPGVTL